MDSSRSGATCYVCGSPSTSDDHLPPKSCFLKPRPTNLLKVPSCSVHNGKRSMDDEYFRLVVTSVCGDDPRAFSHFDGPVMRGLLKRPKGLLSRFRKGG